MVKKTSSWKDKLVSVCLEKATRENGTLRLHERSRNLLQLGVVLAPHRTAPRRAAPRLTEVDVGGARRRRTAGAAPRLVPQSRAPRSSGASSDKTRFQVESTVQSFFTQHQSLKAGWRHFQAPRSSLRRPPRHAHIVLEDESETLFLGVEAQAQRQVSN